MFTKVQAQEPANEQGKDSEWGFGQFLSTFLLALPILNLAEACYGQFNQFFLYISISIAKTPIN